MGHVQFFHEFYDLDEKTGELRRKYGTSQRLTADEQNRESCSVLEALTAFVQVLLFRLAWADVGLGTYDITWTDRALDT